MEKDLDHLQRMTAVSAEGPVLATGVSVVVPVYHSQASLQPLVARLEPALTALVGVGNFELILVNDGSRDGSWSTISRLAAARPWVLGIDLMRNYGQHNALLCGLRAARFNVTVTMDDDLQHPPEELPLLLAALEDDVDVVYGYPQDERHSGLRNLASVVTKIVLQRVLGAETARHISAWRALRTDLRRAFARYESPLVNIDVLLTWGTNRFRAIALRHEKRTLGTSNYSIPMLVRHTVNMMTGFSILPLQLASWVGFTFTLFGLGTLGYVVVRYLLQGQVVPGFAFLASIISVFSGAQLFALGIIGEYLARMHLRVMDRPAYIARRHLENGDNTDDGRWALEPGRGGGRA